MGRPRTFGRLTDQQRDLAESGLKLAYKAAHRAAARLGADREAAIDAAMWGLVRAAAKFKDALAAWSTYCTTSVTWEVLRSLTGRAAGEMELAPDGAAESLPDRPERPPADPSSEAERLLALADPEAAEAVRLYVVEGRALKETARQLGVPARVATRLVGEGLAAIRAGMEGAEGHDACKAAA